uniref:UDP-glucuronosyltransferase n=1 Tax=Chilo suppressalis TaxID=168631 RepID=A0A481XUC5_CHISP|nr:UDP-glycosyltransferase UGT340D1 [Chilo suppressalis]
MLLSSTISAVILLAAAADSARILGVFPVPSISHQYVFRTLTLELAKRGHELVVITPDPAFLKTKPPYNITEIDVSSSYNIVKQFQSDMTNYKRGVVVDVKTMLSFDTYRKMLQVYVEQLNHPAVEKIIQDKNQQFDLIILEGFLNYHLILTEIFKAPAILISSFHGFAESYEIVGAVARHPIFYPGIMRKNYENLTLIEKIYEAKMEYDYMRVFQQVDDYENQLLKTKFGPKSPTVSELKNNIDFLLINSNQIFCNNRPVPPNVAFVGPLHLQPLKELPQDLKSYMDNSDTGVIYVSLGTNVRPSNMDEELLNAFLGAFEALPYDILWKFDGDNLTKIPKNVKIQKWFPQRDLLAHPNVKLFVMQGGLQSTDEAIDAGVPLVTIPMLGDQYFNAHKHEQLGIGVKLDALTLDAKALLEGIRHVLNNKSYRENIRKLKEIMDDQLQTPMERAVWWTEYVIRHKGARHLRSLAANISWAEYLMADVLFTLAAIAFSTLLAIALVIKFMLSTLFRISVTKNKIKQS